MSNENPLTVGQSVVRNGITRVLNVFTGKRGAWEGKNYQAPQLTLETFDEDVEFLGKQNIINPMNVILRRFGQDYVEDSTGEDGIFSVERFINYWTELRASALKLSELNEAYQKAVADYQLFTSTTLLEEVQSGDPARKDAAKDTMTRMNGVISALRKDYEERKARRSKEAATETTSPE